MEVDVTAKAKNFLRFGLLGLILTALLVGSGVYYYQHSKSASIVYDAKVVSNIVPISTKNPAIITELLVADGDEVAAGDVIAKVKSTVTDEEIAQLTQNRDLAQKSLDQLKKGVTVAVPSAPVTVPSYDAGAAQRVADAQARMNRMNQLYSMGAISAVKRDEAVADYNAAKAAASTPPPVSAPAVTTTTKAASPEAIASAETALKQAEIALNNAKAAQAVTDIVAPVDGTISFADDMAAGAELEANQQLAQLADANEVWLEITADNVQADRLHLGQLANYAIDGHNLQGTVQNIEDDADDENIKKITVSIPKDLDFTIPNDTTTIVKFVS